MKKNCVLTIYDFRLKLINNNQIMEHITLLKKIKNSTIYILCHWKWKFKIDF